MKSSKRLLAALLACLLLCGGLALGAGAATDGDWAYILQDGEAMLTFYAGTETDLTIPNKVKDGGNEYPVVSLGNYFLPEGNGVTRITIPASVQSLYSSAFAYADKVEEYVVLPGNAYFEARGGVLYKTSTNDGSFNLVRYPAGRGDTSYTVEPCDKIADYAFRLCTSLKSVTLPEGIKSIGYQGFSYCEALESIALPDTLELIGNYAFYGCSSLQSISLPDSVTSIGSSAFTGCDGLESIRLSGGLDTQYLYTIVSPQVDALPNLTSLDIGKCPLSMDQLNWLVLRSTLTEILVDADNPAYASVGGVLFSKDMKTLYKCPPTKSGASYSVPGTVTAIAIGAFYNCTDLEAIDIPDSVTDIGFFAFTGCTGLESVTLPSGLTDLGTGVFLNCTSLESVVIPEGVRSIGNNREGSTYYTGGGTFEGCTSLTSVTIPDGVTAIHCYAFRNCTALESLFIPESVTNFDPSDPPFAGCTNLTISGSWYAPAKTYAASKSIPYVAIDGVPAVTGIVVTASAEEMVFGESVQLTAEIEGTNLREQLKTITWSVDDGYLGPYYAQVDANGVLTMTQARGSAYALRVKATSSYDTSKSAIVTVSLVPSAASQKARLKERIDFVSGFTQKKKVSGTLYEMYTDENWAKIKNALAQANSIYNDPDATWQQVLAADNALWEVQTRTPIYLVEYFKLWGKETVYEKTTLNWIMLIFLFGWIWMWF